jgi:hypothetical protein
MPNLELFGVQEVKLVLCGIDRNIKSAYLFL